ncbi:MAG: hypothetical protein OEW64_12810 [Gammaproteobacteria bacterium]|nr:hypothetical protein [Gammaproteobacteria bacterium]MDH5304963.1 hypothetical protein [Gammaproteobacteria bacterium]MDH5322011.1 hypothetical protein [Gammaproteobacteria bacterium]
MLRRFLYVQVHRGHFAVRVVNGTAALTRQCAALNHPRSIFGEFEPIRAAFAEAFKAIGGFRLGLFGPSGLIHLIPHLEGGYTHAELRAFRQAAQAAGMYLPYMLDDKHDPPTDKQIMQVVSELRIVG